MVNQDTSSDVSSVSSSFEGKSTHRSAANLHGAGYTIAHQKEIETENAAYIKARGMGPSTHIPAHHQSHSYAHSAGAHATPSNTHGAAYSIEHSQEAKSSKSASKKRSASGETKKHRSASAETKKTVAKTASKEVHATEKSVDLKKAATGAAVAGAVAHGASAHHHEESVSLKKKGSGHHAVAVAVHADTGAHAPHHSSHHSHGDGHVIAAGHEIHHADAHSSGHHGMQVNSHATSHTVHMENALPAHSAHHGHHEAHHEVHHGHGGHVQTHHSGHAHGGHHEEAHFGGHGGHGHHAVETVAHGDNLIVNTRYATRSHSEELFDDPNIRRVVRKVERQAPRLVHHEEVISNINDGRIIKEYEFEEQVAVEYTAIREDVVEHIVAVPVTEAEVRKEKLPVRVIEVEKIVPVERIVEVPQVEYVEKLNEVPTPSGRVQKKFNYVPVKKVVPVEKKIYVERPIERIVEVPQITYHDVEEVIETVEVPEYQDVIKVVEVKVPTIIEVPVDHVTERDIVTDVPVLIPVGVAAITKVQYTVPTIIEKRQARGYPVYVPRFIEVPTNSIQLTPDQRARSKKLLNQMKELEHAHLNGGKIVSVCEVEKLGVAARDHQTCIQGHIDASDIKASILNVFGTDVPRDVSIHSDHELHALHADGHHVADHTEGYYGHKNVAGAWSGVQYFEAPVSHAPTGGMSTIEQHAANNGQRQYSVGSRMISYQGSFLTPQSYGHSAQGPKVI